MNRSMSHETVIDKLPTMDVEQAKDELIKSIS